MRFSNDLRQGNFVLSQYLRAIKKPSGMVGVNGKALVWSGLIFAGFGMVFGFEVLVEVLGGLVEIIVEFVQASLESFYHKQCKLELYYAQMATAYTVFFMVLGIGYLFSRRIFAVLCNIRNSWYLCQEKAMKALACYLHRLMGRWEAMDSFNKCFALIGLVVVALPMVSIACVVLARVVAELIELI